MFGTIKGIDSGRLSREGQTGLGILFVANEVKQPLLLAVFCCSRKSNSPSATVLRKNPCFFLILFVISLTPLFLSYCIPIFSILLSPNSCPTLDSDDDSFAKESGYSGLASAATHSSQ